MKKLIVPLFIIIALVFCQNALLAKEQDISGIWEGTTLVPNAGEDHVTLTLQKEGETYSGTVSDSLGMVAGAKLENTQYKDGELKAEFQVFNGNAYITISLTLKVSGEVLVGYWTDMGNTTGNLELKRKP